MKHKKTIGIFGGSGPLATLNIYSKIIEYAQKDYHAVQDSDFPPIIVYSIPLDGFNEKGIKNFNLVKKQLPRGVDKLQKSGCDMIIIACNTLHFFYKEIQKQTTIPVLNMISETTMIISKYKPKIVGLLSSASTENLQLYQKELAPLGIKVLTVTKKQQRILDEIILHVMSGIQNSKDKKNLTEVIKYLSNRGAKSIIVGCTELSLLVKEGVESIVIFDSSEIIVKTALKQAFGV